MRKYWSFFRIRFIAGLQYRAAALAGICTQFFWGTMTLLLYRAFYQNGGSAFPMTFPELSCYIWPGAGAGVVTEAERRIGVSFEHY